MRAAVALLVATLLGGCCAQFEDETKEYMGQYIGELNSYHHQVKRNVIFDAQNLYNRLNFLSHFGIFSNRVGI